MLQLQGVLRREQLPVVLRMHLDELDTLVHAQGAEHAPLGAQDLDLLLKGQRRYLRTVQQLRREFGQGLGFGIRQLQEIHQDLHAWLHL
ncbi:hypothetical protein GALL_447720 [mine drainage metagenome]|uniref:Uncharacterized protein n=1 Tax=mine drainage metagenome TaxID=410659 RepID=A0A1J5Q147_9ZZZZ